MNIRIPVKIITPKISHRTDSIFYSGKNIAEVKVRNRTYILTTAGEYKFTYTNASGKTRVGNEHCSMLKRWKDHKIRWLDRNGYVNNWGGFGISVWETISGQEHGVYPTPSDVYSTYDEAMKAFIKYVTKDLTK
jgi:hypothetical protein